MCCCQIKIWIQISAQATEFLWENHWIALHLSSWICMKWTTDTSFPSPCLSHLHGESLSLAAGTTTDSWFSSAIEMHLNNMPQCLSVQAPVALSSTWPFPLSRTGLCLVLPLLQTGRFSCDPVTPSECCRVSAKLHGSYTGWREAYPPLSLLPLHSTTDSWHMVQLVKVFGKQREKTVSLLPCPLWGRACVLDIVLHTR